MEITLVNIYALYHETYKVQFSKELALLIIIIQVTTII